MSSHVEMAHTNLEYFALLTLVTAIVTQLRLQLSTLEIATVAYMHLMCHIHAPATEAYMRLQQLHTCVHISNELSSSLHCTL